MPCSFPISTIRAYFRQVEPGHARQFQEPSAFDAASACQYNPCHDAPANAVAFGATMCNYSFVWFLAETARTRMEGAICCLARWRAAGWKNLPLPGSPRWDSKPGTRFRLRYNHS